MKKTPSIIIFITLQLIIIGDVIGGDKLSINSANWLESKTAKITWSIPSSMNAISYSIFINEGRQNEFPRDVAVTQIDKDATAWESTPRETISALNHLGVDIRSPGQWGNKSILTPGYTYTVGIEIEYLDKETRAKKKQEAMVVLSPLGVYKSSNTGHFDKFTDKDINQYNEPYAKFSKGHGIFLLESKYHSIVGINKLKDRDIFKLDNSHEVHVFYRPNRPEVFGGFDAAYMMLLTLGFTVLIMIAIALLYVFFHMFDIWNISTSESGQLEKIIEAKVNAGVIGVISLYLYIRFFKVFNKIYTLMFFDLELSKEQIDLLDKIGNILSNCHIYQQQEIKEKISPLLSGKTPV